MAATTGATSPTGPWTWTQWTEGLDRAWAAAEDALRRARVVAEVGFPVAPPVARWATENEAEALTDTLVLRRFGAAPAPEVAPARPLLPVLIVTPQVNHSYIADFAPGQSLVRTIRAAGAPLVGVTDWQPPPRRAYGIADSIDDVRGAIRALGGRVHLVGLCQGGWQAAIVAALAPDEVATLTVAAAPIDPHAGVSPLHPVTLGLPLAFFRGVVALGGGNAPGVVLSAGFDCLKPFERSFGHYAALWLNAHDERYVARYRALRNWYRLEKDVAGQLYLEAVRDLFQHNRLARGRLTVRGERVDLGRIRCPLFVLAGARDHITPPPQVLALPALAPDAPARTWTVDAGHVGVFMGRRALATVWPEVVAGFAAG